MGRDANERRAESTGLRCPRTWRVARCLSCLLVATSSVLAACGAPQMPVQAAKACLADEKNRTKCLSDLPELKGEADQNFIGCFFFVDGKWVDAGQISARSGETIVSMLTSADGKCAGLLDLPEGERAQCEETARTALEHFASGTFRHANVKAATRLCGVALSGFLDDVRRRAASEQAARAASDAAKLESERQAAAQKAKEKSEKTLAEVRDSSRRTVKDFSVGCKDAVAQKVLLETDLERCVVAGREGLAEGILRELESSKQSCVRQFAETGKQQACTSERSLPSGDSRLIDGLKACSAECRKEGPAARKDWLADQAAEKRRAAEEAAEARRRPASSSSSSSPAISDSCKTVLIECAQLVNQRNGSRAEMEGCVEQNGCARYLKK